MTEKSILSLHTLPVEVVYRILDHLNKFNILWSMRNVCTRINTIVDTYQRYQVRFFVYFKILFFHLSFRKIDRNSLRHSDYLIRCI
jgi:hypothetical protein